MAYLWCSVRWSSLHVVPVDLIHQTVAAQFHKLGGTSLEGRLLEGVEVGQFHLVLGPL